MPVSHRRKYCYGRLAPPPGALDGVPRFTALSPQLPPPPASVDFTGGIAPDAWGLLGNGRLGNCTEAAVAHFQMGVSAASGTTIAIPESDVVAEYCRLSGCDPATGVPDPGLAETDVLDDWKARGQFGDRLEGYVAINPVSLTHVKQAIWIFGGVYLGYRMPADAQDQFEANQPWTLSWFPQPIEGGHAVYAPAYDGNYLYVVTWGRLQPVSWSWHCFYRDAAYAPLSRRWFGVGHSPGGLDLPQLLADLPAVAG